MASEMGFAPVNFDADGIRQSRKLAKKVLEMFSGYDVYFRKSSSGRGYHFIVADGNRTLYLPKKMVLNLRKACGDCFGRLRVDGQRIADGGQISILFNWKNGRSAGKWKKLRRISQIKQCRTKV